MKKDIIIPAMGESISEATIGQILKPTGSVVKMDEEILEIETDKVNQVLYAPQEGTITINVQPGDTVKIGQIIGAVEEGVTLQSQSSEPAVVEPAPQVALSSPLLKEEPKAEPVKSSQATTQGPSVRKGVQDFVQDVQQKPSVSLSQQTLSQQQVKESFPKQSSVPFAEEGRETRRKMTKIRKVIAQRLVEAQHQAAMLTTFNEVDLSEVMAIREKYKETFQKQYGVKLGFMSFFVKATISALKKVPELNSYIDGDDIVHREYFDIGIAVGTDRGLIVPVIRNCDRASFGEIETYIEEMAKKAKEGTIRLEDLQGGGFTITNGGVYGSLLSTPILNPPQSGILGMHKIMKRPVVVEDKIVVRPMMYLALSYDHRIIDGKEAVTFLVHIKNSLEDPSRLLLDF